MTWRDDCEAWLGASASAAGGQVLNEIARRAARELPHATAEDWAFFAACLGDERRRGFVGLVMRGQSVPKRLFEPMIRAAVYERDPSRNRAFIEPCVESYGPARVCAALIAYIEGGTNFEKAGAVNALYWARDDRRKTGRHSEKSKRELVGETGQLSDVAKRLELLLLEEFVWNEDVDVRRSIIAWLSQRQSELPETHRALVTEAMRIASEHPDEYIRSRYDVWTGQGRSLEPLPHRSDRRD